jgi:hypothetical protein
MLSDWWNRQDGRAMAAGLVQQPFHWVGPPQSILHNGKGNYTCPLSPGAPCTASQTPAQVLEQVVVQPGKTYLLRLVAATTLHFLDFAVEGHTLTVVEADGNYVAPYETTHLPINSGERYGVLLRTRARQQEPPPPPEQEQQQQEQQQQSYWIATETRFRALLKGYAVLQYQSSASPEPPPLVLPPTPAADFHHPGTWAPEILALQTRYMTMLGDGAPAEAWEPVRDQTYRLQAQAAIDWTRGLRALAPQSAAVLRGNATRELRLVQHQCRASRDGAVVYTPYDPVTETYLTRNNGEGYLR